MENRIKILEEKIQKINERNLQVEQDKSWEVSWFRIISVAGTTYIIILLIMWILNFNFIFISALIPTFGYLLSTLSIKVLKKVYIKKSK
jgi:hypothetical protein